MSKKRESGMPQRWASGRSQTLAETRMDERLRDVDLDDQERVGALIDVLRSLPPNDETVGKDCLVTAIKRSSPQVHIRYEAHDIRQLAVVFTGRTVTVPAAFTPWVITPGVIARPQMISGWGPTIHSGDFTVAVEASNPSGDLTIMSSQPRRLWP